MIEERSPELSEEALAVKLLVRKTYKVMILMLLLGQLHNYILMGLVQLSKAFYATYYVSLAKFFVSFLSLQLYVFFYRILVEKQLWKRILAGIWTYEINTISLLKRPKKAVYVSHLVSFALTFIVMGISAICAQLASSYRYGIFISRHNLIRWSERIWVLTSFGIIVCSEMKREQFELTAMIIYTTFANIFVFIFAASIKKPNFYHIYSKSDHILIGLLYYTNFYALYMCYVWTISAYVNFTGFEMAFNRNLTTFPFDRYGKG